MGNSDSDSNLHVVLCFDEKYANQAAVATWSAFKHSAPDITFHWFFEKACSELATQLRIKLERKGVAVHLHEVGLQFASEWKTAFHFTSAMYLRLCAPILLSSHEKVIYLDCDVIVNSDLGPLFSTQMGDSLIAGVIDEGGEAGCKVQRIPGDRYINTGVLLMNLEALRKDNFLNKLQDLYPAIEDQLIWPDQCLINKYAEGRKVILDESWNRQIFSNETSKDEFQKLVDTQPSSILHFVGAVKPWHGWCNPTIAEYWWQYAIELKFEGFKPAPITSLTNLISLADILHFNGRFEESSALKSHAIRSLLDGINRKSAARASERARFASLGPDIDPKK